MYCVINFKTKKALKEAVALRQRWLIAVAESTPPGSTDLAELKALPPARITFFQPNDMFGITPTNNGVETVEGPHLPKPHTWYARCTIVDGEVVKVS